MTFAGLLSHRSDSGAVGGATERAIGLQQVLLQRFPDVYYRQTRDVSWSTRNSEKNGRLNKQTKVVLVVAVDLL